MAPLKLSGLLRKYSCVSVFGSTAGTTDTFGSLAMAAGAAEGAAIASEEAAAEGAAEGAAAAGATAAALEASELVLVFVDDFEAFESSCFICSYFLYAFQANFRASPLGNPYF